MNVISLLADTFNNVILGLWSILHKFLHTNFALVASVITTFENLKKIVLEQVLPDLNVLQCCYQDFIIFLYEVISIASVIISIVSDFVYKLYFSICYALFLFQELGYIIHQNVTNFSTSLYICGLQMYEYAVYFMQLIFSSLILILELGPNCFIFMYEITLQCAHHLFGTVEKGSKSFINNLYDACSKSKEAVFSIPVKAYVGILLLITIFYQHKVMIIFLKAYIALLFLFFDHIGKQISHFTYICLKPVINITMNAFHKINCIFSSVEETDVSNEMDSNFFPIQRNPAKKNLFQVCIQKVRTFFNKYYFKDRSMEEQIEQLQKELTAEREKHLCVICFDKPRSMILYPCRHMCICNECYIRSVRHAELLRCPLCRHNVENVFRVFT